MNQSDFVTKWGQRSYNSGDAALKALKKYNRFLETINESDESILHKLGAIKETPEFYLFLNRIVSYFSESLHPNSVKLYFSFVKDYYRKNGFRIYNEDIKQFVDFGKVQKEKKVPLTKETIEMLLHNASPYMRGTILVLVSSGMREDEFLQQTVNDIKWDATPVEIHMRSETTKMGIDRITYLTPQAAKNFPKIKPYDEEKSLIRLENSFAELRKKCKLNEKYRHSNIHHVTLHRLRAYCKTQASMHVGKDFAEDLIGHEGYLPTYYSPTDQERRDMYTKLVPHLTFDVRDPPN